MVIWMIRSSIDYLPLDFADDSEVLHPHDYLTGKTSEWNPIQVTYMTWVSDDTDERHERLSNFPYLSAYFVCDERAKSVLEGPVHEHVEFLPLRSRTIVDKQYYLLRATTLLGRRDADRNETVNPLGDLKLLFRNKPFFFSPGSFDEVPMFRLPGVSEIDVFVSNKFKHLVEENNLTGLEFTKVWEV